MNSNNNVIFAVRVFVSESLQRLKHPTASDFEEISLQDGGRPDVTKIVLLDITPKNICIFIWVDI